VARGFTHLVPRPARLAASRWLAGRASARFERDFEAVVAGADPIIAGPWLGEVGFELLYWVPFLASLPCLYAWYLHVRGVERVQSLDAGRAMLATTLGWIAVWLIVRGFSCQGLAWIGTR